MTGVPRRMRPTPAERLQNIVPRFNQGAGGGLTGNVAPVNNIRPRAQLAVTLGSIAVVKHGDDPTYPRPDVAVAFWVGAATPANGTPYDPQYTADVP